MVLRHMGERLLLRAHKERFLRLEEPKRRDTRRV